MTPQAALINFYSYHYGIFGSPRIVMSFVLCFKFFLLWTASSFDPCKNQRQFRFHGPSAISRPPFGDQGGTPNLKHIKLPNKARLPLRQRVGPADKSEMTIIIISVTVWAWEMPWKYALPAEGNPYRGLQCPRLPPYCLPSITHCLMSSTTACKLRKKYHRIWKKIIFDHAHISLVQKYYLVYISTT